MALVYDAFLSFRGEDTRKTFTDHLYTALVSTGFCTFRDDPELERGENIKERLKKAIQQSRSSVIVFSKDYTSSRWCLDELVMILERKRTSDHVVLPVFYDVEPSDLREQAENLAKVPKYQENQSTEKLNGWREALREVADLAGMVLQNEADGHEAKFIQKIVGVIQDKLGRRVPLSVVQEKLQKKLSYVNSVLDDAEGKQLNNQTVKDWFNDLKEAAYDAEDLLQEIKTEALRQEMEPESSGNSTSTVQEFVSSPPSYAFDSVLIITEAEKIREKLEDIVKQKKQYLGLEASAGHKLRQATTRETTSLADDSGLYGRDPEKEAILKLLLSNDDAAGEKISVIPIIGMGGIGKTTLAQHVYNDIRVEQHFKLRAWVCVSEESDVIKITQTIYQSVTGETYPIRQLDLLQNKLKEKLMMKRFILVLDDVWNQNYMDWQNLRKPLESGAIGSKIIVTTRNQGVANVMHTDIPSRHLMQISDEDCWLLFARHAFGNADLLNSQHPDLASIGRQIATKCKGLPLAAKSLGGLLRSELNVKEWVEILESDIWEIPEKETNILPALWLSYHYLPSHLKRCFAYCAVFPKDYYFTKSKMVLLWMAEDLLQPEKKKMIEQVGDDYFNDLISRSFFQSSRGKSGSFFQTSRGNSGSLFTMHDLINDLAKFVSGEFCFRLEDHNSSDIVSKTRHFSYMRRGVGIGYPNSDALCRAKSLHTLLSFEKYAFFGRPASTCLRLLNLKCLRLLDLSDFDVRELPNSIGNLKHLRYLDLSFSLIEKLPDALCTLYNLQTLLLYCCQYLVELPINLARLIKLRHIDISNFNSISSTYIKKMPRDIGKLKDLQFLSNFVLDKDTGKNIVELKELQHLHKRLCISGLDNIVCEWDALEANISGMKYLNALVLKWGGDTDDSIQHRQVLEQLQPHANLKKVRIESYGGKSFPNWVGDHSFSNLASVVLVDCMFCLSLPPLGQLPSLVKLHIKGFKEVESVDLKFYGCGVQPFMSLKELRFEDMLEWQEWCYAVGVGDNQEEGEIFPNLCNLILERCPKLTKILPLDKFPKLELLRLSSLKSFTGFSISQESKLLSLSELFINECPKFECFPDGGFDAPKLKKMYIFSCEKFRLMPEGMHTLLPSLEVLHIINCPELESSPEGGLPPALLDLHLNCIKKFFAKRMQWGLQKLNYLWVDSVFPEEVLLQTSLTDLRIFDCPNLTTLDGLRNLDSLRYLSIGRCPELQCLPEEGLPTSLSTLRIYECPRLHWRLQRGTGEDWPKIAHIPDIQLDYRKI